MPLVVFWIVTGTKFIGLSVIVSYARRPVIGLRLVVVWESILFPFVVFLLTILIVSLVRSILGDSWFTLPLGLDDEWVGSHSNVSYTAEQWSSAGWGASWDMSEFCEDGGLLSTRESFRPSLALEFRSRCSNAFVLGLVNVAKKAMEFSSIGSEENPIEVE